MRGLGREAIKAAMRNLSAGMETKVSPLSTTTSSAAGQSASTTIVVGGVIGNAYSMDPVVQVDQERFRPRDSNPEPMGGSSSRGSSSDSGGGSSDW